MTIRAFASIAALVLLVAPAAAQSPAPMGAPVPKKVHVHYDCQNLNVRVTYDNVKDKAIVTWGNRPYGLPHVMSADGARYMNDKLQWWERGDTATLSSVTNGEAGPVLATCTAVAKK